MCDQPALVQAFAAAVKQDTMQAAEMSYVGPEVLLQFRDRERPHAIYIRIDPNALNEAILVLRPGIVRANGEIVDILTEAELIEAWRSFPDAPPGWSESR